MWTTNLVALLFGVGMYAPFAFLPQFLQTPSAAGYGFGASVTESGLMLLPATVAMFVLGLVRRPAGAARSGSKTVLIVGALGLSGSATCSSPSRTTHEWEIYLVYRDPGRRASAWPSPRCPT